MKEPHSNDQTSPGVLMTPAQKAAAEIRQLENDVHGEAARMNRSVMASIIQSALDAAMEQELLSAVEGSADALSQVLEAVTNLEKLEAEWRDGLPGMSDGEREIYTAYRKGCADELKALLDREK